MEQAILMSIRPRHVANILNGIKTLEIRKKFPKDYVGWVYIYCTKGNNEIVIGDFYASGEYAKSFKKNWKDTNHPILNGKVVARFWCDRVEYIENTYDEFRWGEEDYNTETLNPDVLYEKSCLSFEEMDKYLKCKYGYAIHITKLEIFDKPKEIKEFKHWGYDLDCYSSTNGKTHLSHALVKLTRAPQSWQFIEV